MSDLDTRLMTIRAAHRAVDDRIRQLASDGVSNVLELHRLRKRSLELKGRIGKLERDRLPDIIA